MTAPADNTPISVINDAYLDAGLIQDGDSCNPEQIVAGMRRLTDLINFEQTQGLKLWLNVDTAVTLVAGTGTYTFGPTGTVVMTRPLRVIEAYYVDSQGVRRPLIALSWDDYIKLSQVNVNGQINSYFVDKEQTNLSVFFWNPPDANAATGYAHLLFQTQVTNFTNVTETMNFPIEWRMFLRWGLASEICTGQPQAIMDRCERMANTYRTALEDWDVEDASTSFAPDSRSQYYGQRFR